MTAPAPTAELLPCPFCGSQPDSSYVLGPGGYDCVGYLFECPNECCASKEMPTLKEAVAVWNTRQAASVERAEVAGEAVIDRLMLAVPERPDDSEQARSKLRAVFQEILASPPRSEGVRASEVQSGEPAAWTNESQLGYLKDRAWSEVPMAMWSAPSCAADVPLYRHPAQAENIPNRYRDEMLRGLIAFFSESVHPVWDTGEIADCLAGMMSEASSVPSANSEAGK